MALESKVDTASKEVKTFGDQLKKLETDFATFKTTVEGQPAANHSQRPISTGGNGIQQTDC